MSEFSTPKIMLVDGMALLFRAYYASSYSGYIQKTSAGLPTNAVHGFVKYLWDAVQTFRPSHVACCWDMGSTTFRTEKFDGYKANRGAPPDELIPQFDLVKEVAASFRIPNVGIAGYEADDCIGTLARQFGAEGTDVLVLTGDHDMLQLIDERVSVAIMKKGASNYAVYTPATLLEERQLTPQQVVDLKGLMGDTSDNYPGVKGIGEKTALKLVQQYGSVEGILANLAELPKGVRGKIEAELEMLHLSRDLARIRCDVPLACAFEDCLWAYDRHEVISKFEELEFKGLKQLIG
ncbi:5'-3' exonuclease [Paenibacillus cymbidii]|uniref:5'-3' exonuclease n=1 Tax=Paenibacillus cymbidii TaxID=1639034 RepID=UPI001081A27F|nr:5'-3' exonuclease H3TH domain-containing protein [Paenibacillus cymbidii]